MNAKKATQKNKRDEKESYVQLSLIEQQIQQLSSQIQQIEEQFSSAQKTKDALIYLENMQEDKPGLAPLANGMFIPATFHKTKKIHINSGRGLVVEQSVEEAKKMVQDHLSQMEQQIFQNQKAIDSLVEKAQKIKEEVA